MKIFLLSLISLTLSAQSIGFTCAPATVQIGASTTCTLAFNDSLISAGMAAMQWTTSLPTGLTGATPVAVGETVSLTKTISCGTALCLDYGINTTTFLSGSLATVQVTAGSGTALGANVITAVNVLGASATGTAVTLSVTNFTLTVTPSKYDLNGDGVVDSKDVQLAIGLATAGTCSAPFSAVGDGKCNVVDVMLEILAALGIIH